MTVRLGAIADDFTGATDLALLIRESGYSVVQTIGVPQDPSGLPDSDAIVVALKSRTSPVEDAVGQSLLACRFLQGRGAEQLFFKYCSTFDSTPTGNIGPVADALLAETGGSIAVACPAFPENGRTVYRGHLFVNQQLLSESSLRDHPLTPMTDANLVRVLTPQTRHAVGLLDIDQVEAGPGAIRSQLSLHKEHGEKLVIVDAINNGHLEAIGEAVCDHELVTGGSALGASLVRARCRREGRESGQECAPLVIPEGRSAVLAGSCSAATLGQVEYARKRMPAIKLDIDAIAHDEFDPDAVLSWACEGARQGPVMIYASESAAARQRYTHSLSAEELGSRIERALAQLVPRLVNGGFTRLVLAGGETSGAVVSCLNVAYLKIGAQIDPGVPWTVTGGDRPVALALKSGNFGAEDFFLKAFEALEDAA